MIYLAEKTGKLLGSTKSQKYETIQWLMFQMGGVGPMFGQIGYFNKFAGTRIEDKRPLQRYVDEANRLLEVIDDQLQGRDWMTGEFSIADIALAPWLNGLGNYNALELFGWDDFKNVVAYRDRFYARPTVEKAKNIPPREG